MNKVTRKLERKEVVDLITYIILATCIGIVGLVFLAKPVMLAAGAAIAWIAAHWAGLSAAAFVLIATAAIGYAIQEGDKLNRLRRGIMTHVCRRCGSECHARYATVGGNGGRGVWFLLGIIGLFFFLIPGLICFAIGASLKPSIRVRLCPACGSDDVIPIGTPAARQITQGATPAVLPPAKS